jgi:predicted MFS family arabinose efflux permease
LALPAAAAVLATAGSSITVAFIVLSAAELHGSATAAALLLALGSAASMVSRIEAGRRATRTAGLALRTAAAVCLLGAVGALLLSTAAPLALVPATLLLFGFGTGWPGLLVYATVAGNPERPGHAAGVLEASMNFGGAIGPLVFSLALAGWGLGPAWLVPAVAFIGAGGLMVAAAKGVRHA